MKKFYELGIGERFKFRQGSDGGIHMRVDVGRCDIPNAYMVGDSGIIDTVSDPITEVMTLHETIVAGWK